MILKDSMDDSFHHDGKRIFYLVPVDKGSVFGGFEKEKIYREFRYFNEDGTLIGSYKAYDDFVKLQNITPVLAKEYYLQTIKEQNGGSGYGTNQMP